MIEPVLTAVEIADIRPTQMTVGLREVELKRKQWRELGTKEADFLGRHMIPVVEGPKDRLYSIDHHHLLRALHDEGVEKVLANVVAKLTHLRKDAFWFVLDVRSWVFPYNEKGQRCDFSDIPKTVAELTDDIWRSLAGATQSAGGYAKETEPFAEFVWADFLRRNMTQYLPGWCGQR